MQNLRLLANLDGHRQHACSGLHTGRLVSQISGGVKHFSCFDNFVVFDERQF